MKKRVTNLLLPIIFWAKIRLNLEPHETPAKDFVNRHSGVYLP